MFRSWACLILVGLLAASDVALAKWRSPTQKLQQIPKSSPLPPTYGKEPKKEKYEFLKVNIPTASTERAKRDRKELGFRIRTSASSSPNDIHRVADFIDWRVPPALLELLDSTDATIVIGSGAGKQHAIRDRNAFIVVEYDSEGRTQLPKGGEPLLTTLFGLLARTYGYDKDTHFIRAFEADKAKLGNRDRFASFSQSGALYFLSPASRKKLEQQWPHLYRFWNIDPLNLWKRGGMGAKSPPP